MKYFIVPTVIGNVKLFAVEEAGGYVLKYCSTREDAESYIKKEEDDEKGLTTNA